MIAAVNLGALYDPARGGARPALIDCRDWEAPREFSHRDIDQQADACARGLLARGLARGDRVGILAANRAEYLIAYCGTLRAGLVAVPINHRFPDETIAFIVTDAALKHVLVDGPWRARVPPGAPVADFDDAGQGGFGALLDPGPFETVRPAADEIAMILYTSGSTGRPKGVPLTHAGHLWALEARTRRGGPFDRHRLLVAAPLYHMNALCTSLFALGASASSVLLPEFDAKRYLQAIARFKCTWLTAVPAMLAMALREKELIAKLDFSSVETVRMGSAPLSPKLMRAVEEAFPRAFVMNAYGTTEAGPIVFGPRPDRAPPPLSVGWPMPGVEVKLIDDAGREADEGELWQRTPATMAGYLNLPEKTREVLTVDGWYRSGDVFRRDADGAYTFVGRIDDMFVCGGENIFPGAVEKLLESHDGVAQACVVSVPDDIKGEKPVAFVVRRAGSELHEAELKQFALARGPAYQHPRMVVYMEALPIAGPGKIDRKTLQARARELWVQAAPEEVAS